MSFQVIECEQGSPARKRVPIRAGLRFGMLVTVDVAGAAADGHRTWICRCDCGKTCIRKTNVLRASERRRSMSSCGCVSEEVNRTQATTHGMRGTREYGSWRSAVERCCNPNSKDFHRYGAAGVLICPEWRESFEAFYEDMGPRPAGTTLDRWPDRFGNYEPGNCRWATAAQQANNRRNTVFVVGQDGRKEPLSDVSRRLGISYGAAFMRLKRGNLNDYRGL